MYHDTGGGMDRKVGPCSWFIVSGGNNYIMDKWKARCDEYWQKNDKCHNYFWMDSLFRALFENDEEFRNRWNNVPYVFAREDGNAHTLSIHKMESNTPKIKEMITSNPPFVIKLWKQYNMNRPNSESNADHVMKVALGEAQISGSSSLKV
jgi:hypothetical protein